MENKKSNPKELPCAVTLWFEEDENGEIQWVEHGEQTELKIDVTKIPEHVGRNIGRAFYNAYMEFIRDPENRKLIGVDENGKVVKKQ